MSYKEITIYTPDGTQPHIAAQDDAFIYDAFTGGRSGALGALACVKADNNTVQLSGGGVINKGYIMYIPLGAVHELSIANGSQGLNRHDLVVSRFTRGGGETADSHEFAVVQGTAALNPTDPELTTSDLSGSGNINETALFRICIEDLEITAVESVCDSAVSYKDTDTVSEIELGGDVSATFAVDGSQSGAVQVSVNGLCGAPVTISAQEPASPAEGDIWIAYGE